MQKNITLYVVLILASFFSECAQADDSITRLTCFSVKQNKLSQPYSCISTSGFGAGGNWDQIQFDGKNYKYIEETDPSAENPADAKIISQTLNQLPAHAYIRALKYPNQILVKNASSQTTVAGLFCIKTVKVDICEEF